MTRKCWGVMRPFRRPLVKLGWLAFLVGWLIALPASGQTPAPRLFRAGAATSNITPPLGSDIFGGFVPFPSTHVHDELYARCLALDDGKVKLVLVVCDLAGLDRLVSEEARAEITFFLRRARGVRPGEPNNFRVEAVERFVQQFMGVAATITISSRSSVAVSAALASGAASTLVS